MSGGGREVWEERREPRGVLSTLLLWAFVLFNAWVAIEVVTLLWRIEDLRAKAGDNGLAMVGISAVGNARLNEWLVWWLAFGGPWALVLWLTRGRKLLVRRDVGARQEQAAHSVPVPPQAAPAADLGEAIRSVRRESD